MLITRIDVWNFAPTFRDGPYVMSHVTQDHAYGRILQIQTDKGIYGPGEIVFPPSIKILMKDSYMKINNTE